MQVSKIALTLASLSLMAASGVASARAVATEPSAYTALAATALLNIGADNSADTSAAQAAATLHTLFEDERQFYYSVTPGAGPRGAVRTVANKWGSVSEAARRSEREANTAFMQRLHAIERSSLSPDDQLNYDMFAYMIETRLTFDKYDTHRIPFYSDSGFHTAPTRAWQSINFKSKADYSAYIQRLYDLPRYFAEHTENLKEGIKTGWTMPRVVMEGLLPTFKAPLVEHAEDSAFYGPFAKMSDSLSAPEQEQLRADAKAAIEKAVLPAYQALYDFITQDYMPAARTTLGASEVEGGADYYAAMVRYYTTLDITPDEVHALGLSEVARIRREMDDIIKDVGFKGNFAEFLEFLRTDPQFYAKSETELLMHASYTAKKIDGKLPSLFGKLPRQPYGIEAVPAAIAPNYTTGRYSGAPLDSPRGGYYWVNTYALDKRPLYVLTSLTLHEAVPGHHLQVALSNELENVPEFRLGLYPHAFGEGWGLYAEKLGLDLGIYETPYEQFGRLSYEMWRACRLVIDTGIHAKGWTRDEAIALLEENSALSTHNIRTEVDRYISWPGQALAYKMGELTFLRLRAEAKAALGEAFDIREFHDQVLSLGGVPMAILEDRTRAWMKAKLANAE